MTLVHYLHGALHIYRLPDGRLLRTRPADVLRRAASLGRGPVHRRLPWAAGPRVVRGLDVAAIHRALADAAGRTKRIWLVLGHSEPGRYEEKLWDTAARSIGRVTKVRTGVVEQFGPRRAELERPWLIEVGR